MPIGFLCIVVALFIPLVCTAYAKLSAGGYDNRAPREFLQKLDGKARRADYAQMNHFENFPAFAAGVIVAYQLHAPQSSIDTLAMIFVGARILYSIFYIIDQHVLRTVFWFVGFTATLALFFIGKS